VTTTPSLTSWKKIVNQKLFYKSCHVKDQSITMCKSSVAISEEDFC